MTAITESYHAQMNFGSRAAITSKTTNMTDTYTLDTGLSSNDFFYVTTPDANAYGVGGTVSGGVITFSVNGGPVSGTCFILAVGDD